MRKARDGKAHTRKTEGGELAILRQIRSRAGKSVFPGLTLGIGDDCALLRPRAGEEYAVTTDLTVAGTHFRLDWHTPESAGHRALARGLSDLAAMGARPVAAFLSLGLPREFARQTGRWESSWAARFVDGLLALAEATKTPLAGGDLSETPVVLADIVLVGAVPVGQALLRSGARAGDLLYVTGSIGGGAASLPHLDRLAKLSNAGLGNTGLGHAGLGHAGPEGLRPPRVPKALAALLGRHLAPQPRLAQGLALRRRGLAAAAIDLSDGLSTDLRHLCEESGVAAEIDPAVLPVHPGANLAYALHGGDDYELLFTARPTVRMPKSIAGVPVTRIGRMLALSRRGSLVTLRTASGREALEPRGWEHFT